jgi:addiction module HigA family antidote
MSQKNFALLIGKSRTEVNEIIHGKRDITAQWAFLIGSALGTPIDIWLKLQHNFDTHPNNIKNQQIKYKKK